MCVSECGCVCVGVSNRVCGGVIVCRSGCESSGGVMVSVCEVCTFDSIIQHKLHAHTHTHYTKTI